MPPAPVPLPAEDVPAGGPGILVLGCAGGLAAGCHTSAFLLDDDVLLDAGSGVGRLTVDQMAAIDHVLLSHAHLDHVLALPLLADAVLGARRGRPPIQVYALPATLEVLRTHLFNHQLWPDFTRLPSAQAPVLALQPLAVGQALTLGARQRRIRVLPAAHSVPAVGYAVAGTGPGWWVYTGDTGPNPALWQALRHLPVRDLLVELTFGDDEADLARLSGHHCPASLRQDLAALRPQGADTRLWLSHFKPRPAGGAAAAPACPPVDWSALLGCPAAPLREGQHFALEA
ncbi:3',5'-cyclic-nucleotide phosphodiesterase [Ideonella sp. TBM-1]|uniref:3',5'-cyclic-nucleotide phosphodiesterase n=2 Tax=Ideonella livida TaxID=2707176 RepID=A0A7C9TJK6_9BURK|nr:3',5'-cyclic-nucleotide phosphodiesterase [Ideonella livida]